jgi:hypothetical protein
MSSILGIAGAVAGRFARYFVFHLTAVSASHKSLEAGIEKFSSESGI